MNLSTRLTATFVYGFCLLFAGCFTYPGARQAGSGKDDSEKIFTFTRDACLEKQRSLVGVRLNCERYPWAKDLDESGRLIKSPEAAAVNPAPPEDTPAVATTPAEEPPAAGAESAPETTPPMEKPLPPATETKGTTITDTSAPAAAETRQPVTEKTDQPDTEEEPLVTREDCLEKQSRVVGISYHCDRYPTEEEINAGLAAARKNQPDEDERSSLKSVYQRLIKRKSQPTGRTLTDQEKQCLERQKKLIGVNLRCLDD